MTDRPSDPPSSDEMIRRARRGVAPEPTADLPEEPVTAAVPEPEPAPPFADPDVSRPTDEPVTETSATAVPSSRDDGASLLPEHFQVEAPAASAPKIRWGLIVGVAVVAFLVFRWVTADTPVDDLAVGDCFMAPTEDEISTVETVDCADLHDYEVFAFVDLDDRTGGFPGDFALFEEADEKCFSPFVEYIGEDITATSYVYDVFIPGPDSWGAGNRQSLCAIFAVDEDFTPFRTEGSARGS